MIFGFLIAAAADLTVPLGPDRLVHVEGFSDRLVAVHRSPGRRFGVWSCVDVAPGLSRTNTLSDEGPGSDEGVWVAAEGRLWGWLDGPGREDGLFRCGADGLAIAAVRGPGNTTIDRLAVGAQGEVWLGGQGRQGGLWGVAAGSSTSFPIETGRRLQVTSVMPGGQGMVATVLNQRRPDVLVLDSRTGSLEREYIGIDGAIIRDAQALTSHPWVVGTYGLSGQSTEGLFVAQRGEGWTRKLPFVELEGLLAHLRDGQQRRLADRVAKRKAQGRSSHLALDIVFLEPIRHNGQVLLPGEVVEPEYEPQTRTTTVYDRNGVPIASVTTEWVFRGWMHRTGFVLALDADGQLAWFQSVALGDAVTRAKVPKMRVQATPDGIDVGITDPRGSRLWRLGPDGVGVLQDERRRSYQPGDAVFVGDQLVRWRVAGGLLELSAE